jgi:hypothetical protein
VTPSLLSLLLKTPLGTWGKETFEAVASPPARSTMATEVFDLTPKVLAQEKENNKFAKFVC